MAHHEVVIVGGGISGLAALHFLKEQQPDLSVRLFESDSRLGGTIGTDHLNGYSLDWGPNGFLDREPLTLRLCRELGLDNQLERAGENVSKRFILRKGRLREVPMSPPKFLTSDILSFKGRLRVLTEPLASGPEEGIDESIYHFVQRRIGTEAADYLVQPMVSGIYGGMADRLSLRSCFPIMRDMEAEYGSLFKAMLAKKKQAKQNGKKSGGPAGPGGWLTSFKGGLYGLIEAFNDRYSDHIETGAPVTRVRRSNGHYLIDLTHDRSCTADHIVLATPAYAAADIVQDIAVDLSRTLNAIPYAPIAVVCLGYHRSAVDHALDGFGFLVPAREERTILGSIWTSSIFTDRAPDDYVQFRTMVGGDGDHVSVDLDDDELLHRVIEDLNAIVGLDGDPDLVKIYRWSKGIPQFKIGHHNVMNEIEKELARLETIHVTGNAYYGIGLNDCVKQSYAVVKNILTKVNQPA